MVFPYPGCLATVVKPMQAWLLVLRFSTIRVHMQMAASGATISFPLGNGGLHLCHHRAYMPHLNFL